MINQLEHEGLTPSGQSCCRRSYLSSSRTPSVLFFDNRDICMDFVLNFGSGPASASALGTPSSSRRDAPCLRPGRGGEAPPSSAGHCRRRTSMGRRPTARTRRRSWPEAEVPTVAATAVVSLGSRMMDFGAGAAARASGARLPRSSRSGRSSCTSCLQRRPTSRARTWMLAADCVAYALGDFHEKHLKGKSSPSPAPSSTRARNRTSKLVALIDESTSAP